VQRRPAHIILVDIIFTSNISVLTQKAAWSAVRRFVMYISANLLGVSVYSIWYRRLSCAYLVSSIKLNSFSGTV
jgi:hypothetical protein